MKYNIVFVSGVQHSNSVIHVYVYIYFFFRFSSLIDYCTILSTVSCALNSRSLLVIYFIVSSIYVAREGSGTPLQYSCLEKSHGQRSLVGCSPWIAKSQTQLSDFTLIFTFMHWRRKWQPTQVFLPGESQGRGILVGCHLWGCTELDNTEAT